MINVTKTYLPDKEKYIKYVDEIYENGWITNYGPLVKRLEKRLSEYLGVKNLVLVANGTVALEIAYRALNLKGSVITTPFSFVATTSSLVANGLKPVFADIDKKTLCISPEEIENKITENTSAVLPVHVYGNACGIEEIGSIVAKHGLKIIYDAAHCFGVRYADECILNSGDISVISFHATKLFHTIEGGALVIKDDSLVEKARYLINFGIKDAENIPELGTNAKMNEFEAAMGLCVLDDIDKIMEDRSKTHETYKKELKEIVEFPEMNPKISKYNYAYFPAVFQSEAELKNVQKALNGNNIFPRRYFYPSLDTLPYIKPGQTCPVSRDISERILCLPIYPGIPEESIDKIIKVIKTALRY